MSAVDFSLNIEVVNFFQSKLELQTFVETGTYKGDSVAKVEGLFPVIKSVEINETLYRELETRFQGQDNVQLFQGDSPAFLSKVHKEVADTPALFYLDAHWCGEGTGGESNASQCPLLDELEAIQRIHQDSVIIIDDARLFMGILPRGHNYSQWPTLEDIIPKLMQIQVTSAHRICFLNDQIIYFPARIGEAFQEFAKTISVDCAEIYKLLQEYGDIEGIAYQLDSKEVTILNMERQLIDQERQLKEKDQEIENLIQTLNERLVLINKLAAEVEHTESIVKKIKFLMAAKNWMFGKFYSVKNRIIGFIRRPRSFRLPSPIYVLRSLFTPKLGTFYHYSPRECIYSIRTEAELRFAPVISIVTPSFNQGNFIGDTIESVLNQNYPSLQYIIQDGNSTDNTKEVVNRYIEELHAVRFEDDMGQSDAINKGFSRSSGEIMAWLNSDDLLVPGALQFVASYFEEHPEVDAIYGHRIIIDENGNEVGRWVLPQHDPEVLKYADYVPQETLFWRRSIWEKSGGKIDDSFQFAMDWDFLLRLEAAGAAIRRLDQFLGCFRVHPGQKTSADIGSTGQEEMNLLRRRSLGSVPDENKMYKKVSWYLLKSELLYYQYRLTRKWKAP